MNVHPIMMSYQLCFSSPTENSGLEMFQVMCPKENQTSALYMLSTKERYHQWNLLVVHTAFENFHSNSNAKQGQKHVWYSQRSASLISILFFKLIWLCHCSIEAYWSFAVPERLTCTLFFVVVALLVPLVPALMLSFTNFKEKSKQSHNISHNKSYAVHAHVADILTQALITRLVKSTSRSLSRDYLMMEISD